MLETLQKPLLGLLRMPLEPHPPAGAPGSLQVFRAAPNFWRLRLLGWSVRQVAALLGLGFALLLFHGGLPEHLVRRNPDFRSFRTFMDRTARQNPGLQSLQTLILAAEALGIAAFLVQLPVSFAVARLDYLLRWYLVTDRSLRIRAGIWTVSELTMTFANVQEITIQQNPLHRLLGIADLKVRSAGGGSSTPERGLKRESHVAYFHGVENAAGIRDLILEHLRHCPDAGLGDPGPTPPASPLTASWEALAAARELLAETRALRAAFGRG